MITISENISLREITLQDQKDLFRLMREIYTPVYQHLWTDQGQSYLEKSYAADQLEKDLAEPDTLYGFVQHKAETVGIIRLLEEEPTDFFKDQRAAKLQRIYLGNTARGKGLGKQLMQWMEMHVKGQGTSIFWLEVMDTQEKAIRFYESLGFEKFNAVTFPSTLMHDEYQGMYQMYKTIK